MRAIIAACFISLIASCVTPPPLPSAPHESPASAPEYRLGAADRIRVTVFGEEQLSGDFVVGGNGAVSLPLVGDVEASGLTIREFQRAAEVALSDGFLNTPRVSAEVLNFRPFYILGEVNSPGTYPFSDGLTVLNAVATAQGFTYRANQQLVRIRRSGQASFAEIPLTSTTPVQPGDTIQILERFF